MTTAITATAQAAHWYGLGLTMAWGGGTEGETTYFMDYLSDTIKVALYTTTTINRDTDQFYVTTNEVTGAQYTAGGATLATKTLTESAGVIKFDAADTAWSSGAVASSGTPAYYAVIYDSSIGDATHHPLMGYLDFANKSGGLYSSGAVFTIVWPAAGIFTITIGT